MLHLAVLGAGLEPILHLSSGWIRDDEIGTHSLIRDQSARIFLGDVHGNRCQLNRSFMLLLI